METVETASSRPATSIPPTSTTGSTSTSIELTSPAYDICATPRLVQGGSLLISQGFEVLETYDQDFGDEWAGWIFDGPADAPGFRAFVTGRPDFHAAELTSRLTEPTRIEVEVVDRPERDLEPLAERLRAAIAPEQNPFGPQVFVAVSRNRDTGAGQTRAWVVVERIDDRVLATVDSVLGAEDRAQVCLAPLIGPVRATGEQVQSGPGWRLLEETREGPVAVEVAATPAAFDALWLETRAGTEAPSVDFDREVVVYAGSGTGGCTDLYLTEVDIETGADDGGAVASTLTFVVDRPSCGAGAELAILLPRGYLVAVDRDRLASRVEVRVDAQGGASQPAPVTVDLDG